ncbi:MAG: carboxypeptidase regulatory-like domain-containing protein [Deltaproteobacteria bacterium]
MCPDGYPVRRARGRCVSSWAWLGWLAVVAACSPAGGSGAADAPVSVAPVTVGPVTVDPPPVVVEPVTTPPPQAGNGDSAAAAGEFIDPDEMLVIPSAPVRRRGLLQKQVTCPGGGTTSVSGNVYIPSGELALYNAMVYVPDAELRPFTVGPSCGCEITGEPIASALTDSSGHFVLENVPVGPDIPVVVQVGEWRREFKVDSVEACVDTPIADQTLRLPSKQSEGDIPKIAVATGFADALECLVRKLGIAPEEFTHPRQQGRVNLYAGYGGAERFATSLNGGDPFPPSGALWSDLPSLAAYDIVLLSCDSRTPSKGGAEDKDARSMQAMYDYLNTGGRVFASHYQEVWFQQGPAPFPDLAEYVDDPSFDGDLSAQVVTAFPKGLAMADWALANGASAAQGEIQIEGAQRTILQENPAYAQRWLASESPETVQYLSANTPLGATEADQCGRVVLSDLHVSAGSLPEGDDPGDDFSEAGTGFPDGCVTSGFSPQEKLLAFMLFDISACVVPDSQAPTAPPIIR